MSTFDIRKFLTENRLTTASKVGLKEQEGSKKDTQKHSSVTTKPYGDESVLLSNEELKKRIDALMSNKQDFIPLKAALFAHVESSRTNSKELMLRSIEQIKTPIALITWFYNSILAKAGLKVPDAKKVQEAESVDPNAVSEDTYPNYAQDQDDQDDRDYGYDDGMLDAYEDRQDPDINEGPEPSLLAQAQELVGSELSAYINPDTIEHEDFEDIFSMDFTLQLPANFDEMEAKDIAQYLSNLSYNSSPGGPFLRVRAFVDSASDEYINIGVFAQGGLDI